MNISYRCKCGRTTTYGLKCVACSGPTFDFISKKIDDLEEEKDDPEEEKDDDED